MQEPSELPAVPSHIERLYADFETSSGHPSETSTNPWRNCSAIGAAVSFGDDSPVWFVPRELMVSGWWRDVIAATKNWVNQNVKYDAHVSTNDLRVAIPRSLNQVCTLTAAKLVDSDKTYRGGYGLDVLSREWCKFDIDEYGWRMLPYLEKNKDYGRVPLDLLADYACNDIFANRRLYEYLKQAVPEESMGVWGTEQEMTGLLYRMEQTGVRVRPNDVKMTQLKTLLRIIDLDAELHKLVGRPFRPSVSGDCYDVLCNQYGLPVLSWTDPTSEDGIPGPSFDADTLEKYLQYPGAPVEVIKRMIEYRKLDTFNNLFLKQWDVLHVNGVMHPTYNQCVRTGRMSCSEPNMQQLSGTAKELIVPPDGMSLVVCDASQIEFRFIVHYINNRRCIDAFNEDAWTDFHQHIADMIPTERGPAKTLNFAMGYGQGKKSTVAALKINKDFVGEIISEIEALDLPMSDKKAAIDRATSSRGEQVYNKYHAMLPELKPTSYYAADLCRRRGYARNHYGRRRHLPAQAAHKAFNSLNQSSAGDLVKERAVALDKECPELTPTTQVHDELVGFAHTELAQDERFQRKVVGILNDVARPLSVPIRWTIGVSEKHWGEAKSHDKEKKFK